MSHYIHMHINTSCTACALLRYRALFFSYSGRQPLLGYFSLLFLTHMWRFGVCGPQNKFKIKIDVFWRDWTACSKYDMITILDSIVNILKGCIIWPFNERENLHLDDEWRIWYPNYSYEPKLWGKWIQLSYGFANHLVLNHLFLWQKK